MSSRKFSLEAYFLIKARLETPTYQFNSVGHCSRNFRHPAKPTITSRRRMVREP